MKFVSLFLYSILAFNFKDRTEFWLFFSVYTGIFLIYIYQSTKSENFKGLSLWSWAIAYRLVFLVSVPYLSDDFYRFIWDGTLINRGINPFLHLPSEIYNDVNPYSIYSFLNSPNYYSVYPPLNQALFALFTLLSPKTLLGQIIGLRLLLWAFEIGTCFLVNYFSIKLNRPQMTMLFALNPLVIIETTGNLHFEIVIVFFCLLALYLLPKRIFLSAIAFGSAISVKLIPILLIPLLFLNLEGKRRFLYVLVSMSFLILSFIPFWNAEVFSNFTQSVDLFIRNFEFNASVYYLFRKIGFWIYGYNMIQYIGLGLKIIAGLLVLYVSIKAKNLAIAVLLILLIYLGTATTVHPWYIIPLLAAGLFTDLKLPFLWSYLIVLSYHAYAPSGFEENTLILCIEYLTLAAFGIYEYIQGRFNLDSRLS